MKKFLAVPFVLLAGLLLTVSPALAQGKHGGDQSYITTLDACGYFISNATPSRSSAYTDHDVKHSSESGTFTGVINHYASSPVASLGRVSGSYSETYTTDVAGNVSGTEVFRSKSGSIYQTFSFAPAQCYTVEVSATGNLSFLTSDTPNNCYGVDGQPIPRP